MYNPPNYYFQLILAFSSHGMLFSKLVATIFVSSLLPLSAQQEDEKVEDKLILPKAAATAHKQFSTEPEAAEEVAEFLAKNVPAAPLPAGSDKLDAMRARVSQLHKQRAEYLQDIASGKTNPFAHLYEARPKQIEDLKALTFSLRDINNELNPSKKQLLFSAFFAALQPIGSFLEIADPGEGYTNILSKDQQAELIRLEAAWDTADKDYNTAAKPLHIIGPGQLYTITSLSVPIIVHAPPSSKVIFQTFGGGFFSNKLALIEVEATAAGVAQAEWVSHGDSIGDTFIGVRSASAPPAQNLTITTVQLKLSALPEFPENLPQIPVVPGVKSNLKNQLESELESTNE
jgi:hypothetical protein